MSNQNKNLWKSFGGKGFSAEYAEYSECASSDVNGNDIVATYATKAELPTVNNAKLKLQLGSGQATDTGFTANSSVDATITVPEMTGATASTAGASGIVPAPAVADKDKFLKGDGTWDSPAAADLTYYYYDGEHNGLSVVNSKSSRASLVGTRGNLNNASIQATFKLDWDGVVKELLTVDTLNENKSYLRFGGNASATEGQRYLLPRPTANKFAQTNSDGAIVWGDAPESVPTPTHDNELFVGMSDGTSSWKQLTTVDMSTQLLDENDDPILDELGNAIYDNQPTLWYKLDDRGFYAERALADSDGREIKTTYSTLASTESAISAASQQLTQQIATGYQRKLILGQDNESVEPQRAYIPQNNEYVEASVFLLTNNKITRLTPQPVENGRVFRFLCNVTGTSNECPNFGIEFDTIGSDSSTVEIYIQPNGTRSAYLAHPSVSGGTTISAGKFYQITCCGTCWTLAEFETASA